MSAAKQKGTKFETSIVNWLRDRLGDLSIERRTLNGSRDRGDISGISTIRGYRVVIECKAQARHSLAEWLEEARVEAGNDDAALGVVIFKKRGTANPAEQYVLMDAESFAILLEGGTL